MGVANDNKNNYIVYKRREKIGPYISLHKSQIEKIFQMEKCICKIKLDNGKVGTGFFCLIPFPNKFNSLQVLITCNHILNEQNLLEGTKIKLSLDDEIFQKSIIINNSRKTFTDYGKDITFIEIKPEDDIEDKSILAIDENMLEDDFKHIYEENDVYMMYYAGGKEALSLGKIIYIDENNYTIKHNCKTEKGSSGGPIINLNNFNVIGVHKGSENRFNLGTLLKIPIDEFYKSNKDNNKEVKEKDISKSKIEKIIMNENLEENPIKKNKKTVINIEKDKKGNINNDKISVIMEDENQHSYSLICYLNDKFSLLEKELFKKDPSIINKKLTYLINGGKIDISKTLEQNNITDGSIIYYKVEENNNEDEDEISLIIKSSAQEFKFSFICKRSDKYKVLEQKLYDKYPDLKNKEHYYLCNGNIIDIEKTIKENKIKDSDNIIINFIDIEENDDINVKIKSTDQNFELSIKCKKSDKFKVLEKKLYEKYPNLKKKMHYYLCNGNSIDIEKTIEENKIKDNAIILYNIDIFDNVV